MNYQQDWLMKQIEAMVDFLGHVILGKEPLQYENIDKSQLSETELMIREVDKLRNQGNLREARDLLHKMLEAGEKECLAGAVDFYREVSMLSDEELKRWDFSRDEVYEGLKEVFKILGLENLN